MAKRRGRPPIANARRKMVGFKASEQERARLAAVARLNGQSLAEFLREAAASAAAESTDIDVLRPSMDFQDSQNSARP